MDVKTNFGKEGRPKIVPDGRCRNTTACAIEYVIGVTTRQLSDILTLRRFHVTTF